MQKKSWFFASVVSAILWAAIFIMLTALTNCSKNRDKVLDSVPADTVFVVVTDTIFIDVTVTDTLLVTVTCDTVDLTIEFIVIGDQSAPNVYAYFRNGTEVGRFVVTETFAEPTEVSFVVSFLRMTLGEVITIKKIEGSRAEAIASSIIGIKCSE